MTANLCDAYDAYSSFHAENVACHQARQVISEFKDIVENLQLLTTNYKRGMIIHERAKSSIAKDLSDSHSEIKMLSMKVIHMYYSMKHMFYFFSF